MVALDCGSVPPTGCFNVDVLREREGFFSFFLNSPLITVSWCSGGLMGESPSGKVSPPSPRQNAVIELKLNSHFYVRPPPPSPLLKKHQPRLIGSLGVGNHLPLTSKKMKSTKSYFGTSVQDKTGVRHEKRGFDR